MYFISSLSQSILAPPEHLAPPYTRFCRHAFLLFPCPSGTELWSGKSRSLALPPKTFRCNLDARNWQKGAAEVSFIPSQSAHELNLWLLYLRISALFCHHEFIILSVCQSPLFFYLNGLLVFSVSIMYIRLNPAPPFWAAASEGPYPELRMHLCSRSPMAHNLLLLLFILFPFSFPLVVIFIAVLKFEKCSRNWLLTSSQSFTANTFVR